MDFINQMPTRTAIYMGVFLAIAIILTIYNIIRARKMKGDNRTFVEQHPNVSRIYLAKGAVAITEPVVVHEVDGKSPQQFVEAGKVGVYLVPGKHELKIEYSYTTLGVLNKTVTKSTGIVKKILTVEPYTNYALTFNRKAKEFEFTIMK